MAYSLPEIKEKQISYENVLIKFSLASGFIGFFKPGIYAKIYEKSGEKEEVLTYSRIGLKELSRLRIDSNFAKELAQKIFTDFDSELMDAYRKSLDRGLLEKIENILKEYATELK